MMVSMKLDIIFERNGAEVFRDQPTVDTPEGLEAGAVAAFKMFRKLYPEISLFDVTIRFERAAHSES